MKILKQSTAYNLTVLMIDSADHVSGKTGLTLTINASKNGAAFSGITPTVTELSYGWYKLALTTSHTDTLGDLVLHITGTGADATDISLQIVDYLAGDVYSRIGAPAGASVSADIATVAGYVDTEVAAIKAKTDNLPSDPADASDIAAAFDKIAFNKNTAYLNYMFLLVDDTDGKTPETGLTGISCTRSIDGAAFASCANAASEVGSGWYKIDLSATDLNGDEIVLRFTKAGIARNWEHKIRTNAT